MKDFVRQCFRNVRSIFECRRRGLALWLVWPCITVIALGCWLVLGHWAAQMIFWESLFTFPLAWILFAAVDAFCDRKRHSLSEAELKEVREIEERAKRGMREAWAHMHDPEYQEWQVKAPKDPEHNSLGGSC